MQMQAQDFLALLFGSRTQFGITEGNSLSAPRINGTRQFFEGSAGALPLIRFDSRIDNVYKETRSDGTVRGLQGGFNSAEVIAPLTIGPRPMVFRAKVRSTSVAADIDVDAGQHASYAGSDKYVSAAVDVPITDALNWSAGMSEYVQVGRSSPGYESGISYKNADGVMMLTLRQRPYAQELGLTVNGVDGVLPLDFSQKGVEVSFGIPLRHMTLHLAGHDDMLLPLPEATRRNDTRFSPDGRSWGLSCNLRAEISPVVDALLSLGSESLGGKGIFTSRMSSYGELDTVSLQFDNVQAGIEYEPSASVGIVADVSWSAINAQAAGYAENWPFVSISRLSLSQGHFQGAVEARSVQAHLGALLTLSEGFHTALGVNIVRMTPDAQVTTWQSKFLSFGQQSRMTMQLPFKEVRGLILSGGINRRIGSFEFVYSFSQIALLRTTPTESGRQEVSSAPVVSSVQVHGSGGQFHSLSVVMYL